MSVFVVTLDSDGVVVGYRHEANHEYEVLSSEVVLDDAVFGPHDFKPPGSTILDTSTDPPTVSSNAAYESPDPLDRSEISSDLKQTYRDARDTYLAERQNYVDARDAGDVQGQLDALAGLAENATVPALDVLFKVAMGEEP